VEIIKFILLLLMDVLLSQCWSSNRLTTLDYLVVAGGGGGGYGDAGGGGAGGFRLSNSYYSGCYTISPLAAPCVALTASLQTYPITVGAGGAGGTNPNGLASAGSNSIFNYYFNRRR
jgi:hypothetical protein